MSEKDGGGDQMEWWSVRLRERWRFVCVSVFVLTKGRREIKVVKRGLGDWSRESERYFKRLCGGK